MLNPTGQQNCGFGIDASEVESARSMQRILDDKSNFTDMCRDLLISIPEDLKDQGGGERNLLIMISECIDSSNHIQIDPERVGKFVDEYLGKEKEL